MLKVCFNIFQQMRCPIYKGCVAAGYTLLKNVEQMLKGQIERKHPRTIGENGFVEMLKKQGKIIVSKLYIYGQQISMASHSTCSTFQHFAASLLFIRVYVENDVSTFFQHFQQASLWLYSRVYFTVSYAC